MIAPPWEPDGVENLGQWQEAPQGAAAGSRYQPAAPPLPARPPGCSLRGAPRRAGGTERAQRRLFLSPCATPVLSTAQRVRTRAGDKNMTHQ